MAVPPSPGGAGNGALPPELAALLATRPIWTTSVAVETDAGYKDNLLLSAANAERSAFARGSVEVFLLRLGGRAEYSLFAETNGVRYFSGQTVRHEAGAWLQSDLGYRLNDRLKLSLPLTGYYSDQLFDVSDTEIERLVAEIEVRGAIAGPTLRWNLRPEWWIEAQAAGEQKSYADGSNDGDVGEGTLRLGWTRGGWEARLIGTERWRAFDRRAQYSAAGRELVGTSLRIAERAGEFRLDVPWGRTGAWRTRTRARVLSYRDNGSGYFDFRKRTVGQELEWKTAAWLLRLSGSAARIDYLIQTVGLGINPPARLKDEFDVSLRLERSLSKSWTAVAGFAWERGRSNDPVASYRMNEGLLGLRWSWEK